MGKKKKKKKGAYGNVVWDRFLKEEKPSKFATIWKGRGRDEVRWVGTKK